MNYLKFLFIICCFLNTFKLLSKDGIYKKDVQILQMAMFFTVMADSQMLIFDNKKFGIFLFCIVQVIYCYRYLGFAYCKTVLKILFSMCIIFIITKNESLIALALLYALTSIGTIIAVFRISWTNRTAIRTGMVLFALCDINVALANANLLFLEKYRNLFFSMIWIFYLPSQLILSINGRDSNFARFN